MIQREGFGRVFRVSRETQKHYDELVAKKNKADKAYDRACDRISKFIRKSTPLGATYYHANLITDEHYLECRDPSVF